MIVLRICWNFKIVFRVEYFLSFFLFIILILYLYYKEKLVYDDVWDY